MIFIQYSTQNEQTEKEGREKNKAKAPPSQQNCPTCEGASGSRTYLYVPIWLSYTTKTPIFRLYNA